jgi:UDP-N-acetylglucosamine--N-acetylmuramyl-(pentapeptide) pyrophosphoryl-undecaprenol N-acetylglucosamine transferase
MFQARRIIKKFKPDIVLGTGGYVCGPVLLNASMLKIPTLIHEQNVFPGVTNKILSRFVDTVCISFEESKKYFKTQKIYLTGNPIRKEILTAKKDECRKKLNIGDYEKMLLVYGGSGGAEKINSVLTEYIKSGVPKNIKLLFATGSRQYEKVMDKLKDVNMTKNISVVPYIYNMHEAMPAADLMIGRAGAISISEITAIGLPAVLIPSPNVTDNHQEYNARALQKAGAGEMILEKDLEQLDFKAYIEGIINDSEKLQKMASNSKKLGKNNSAEEIYKYAVDLLEK